MTWWAAKLWLLSWWCGVREHRWVQKRNERLCLRCGRRETRVAPGMSWRHQVPR